MLKFFSGAVIFIILYFYSFCHPVIHIIIICCQNWQIQSGLAFLTFCDSRNHLKNLPLLSNCWCQQRFQQGLRDVPQTLEYWHGLNYICRSKVENEIVPRKSLTSVKNTLHQVLTSIFTWFIWRPALGYLSYMRCACWRRELSGEEMYQNEIENKQGWRRFAGPWCHSWSEKVEQRFERAPLSPFLSQLHNWLNYSIC